MNVCAELGTVEERCEGLKPDIWQPLIVERIATFLPPNVVTCTLRLVNKATHEQFRSRARVDLRLPCPEHAFIARWSGAGALRSQSFGQRRSFLIHTAASGSIPNLKVAFRAIAATLTDEVLDPDSLAPGQLCPWLEGKGCWWLNEVLAGAAGAGQRQMCVWLLACGCPCNIRAPYLAVRGGHLGLMDWLLHQHPDLRALVDAARLIEAAAEGCDLAVLKQLYCEWVQGQGQAQQQWPQESPIPDHLKTVILAAAAGSPTPDWRDKVEWLERLGFPRTSQATSWRVGTVTAPEAVERLAWLRSRGYPVADQPGNRLMGQTALSSGAGAGNTAVVEYMLDEVGAKADVRTAIWHAAGGGHLTVLQALHARGCLSPAAAPDQPGTSRLDLCRAVRCAVREGRLAVATWLVDTFRVTGAELQEVLDEDDAVPGNREMAEWLRGLGCHWQAGLLLIKAAVGGCEELLEFAVSGWDFQPYENARRNPYYIAAQYADIATLRCLHRLGVPMTGGDDVYNAVSGDESDLPVLRCLHSQLRYPWSPTADTFTLWAFDEGRSLPFLRWLVEEARCPVDWEAAARQAAAGGGPDACVREWLRAQ